MERGRINAWQFFLLIFCYLLGTSFFFRPGGLIAAAKQDAWIVPLWAGIVGVLTPLIWIRLARYYPGLTLIQICIKVAGKAVGGLIALLYIGYFVHLSSFVTRNLGDFMTQALMPRTPITVFHVMFLLVICYTVVKGMETIARSTEILFPLVTLAFLFIFCIALSEWDWERFDGMFRMDVWTTMKETRSVLGFPFMETIVFMMLFPYVRSRRTTCFMLGAAAAALSLSSIVFFTIGVLGVSRSSHDTYPLFVIVQEIHIGAFFEHLESTIALILLVAIFIKLSVTYYGAVAGLGQLFQVNDRTWIACSLILIISGLALGYDNVLENIAFSKRYDFEYTSVFSLFLPLLLLVIHWSKYGMGKQKADMTS